MKKSHAVPKLSRRFFGTLLLAAASASLAAVQPAGAADAWPSKPITIVCAFPPGNASDLIARVLGEQLSARLHTPVLVDNRPGASGIIAASAVQKAVPDGHTLLMTSTSFIINKSVLLKVPYDADRDFTPVSLVNAIPAVLIVDKSSPANDFKELLAQIRQRPGKLSYGHPGAGTIQNLSMKLLLQHVDANVLEVPYKGSMQAVTDINGGSLDMMFEAANSVYTLVQSGRVRALATTSPTRYSMLPEVPTLRELGIDETVVGFTALMAPAGTPPEITARLNKMVEDIMKMPATQAREKTMGLENFPPMSTAEVGTWMKQEASRWENVARVANIPKE
ncbi:tripartite tricarboxylate transporter substrate binding protein [Ramlibacter sp. G-1-2-2]|uniref:Tripartite tricarboxylate transporter substrate binding protein n=1 Tax=Ramlibacter agri TaxID=2728837 RepID=A0A848HA23_9BURK|nr:tripartite tricarboxylate transporter substrate binding protein [Ramlibacter agri]NML47866.1 tripartite tricarboxylate transporter substrate binding protein [Ramlibacter agri]